MYQLERKQAAFVLVLAGALAALAGCPKLTGGNVEGYIGPDLKLKFDIATGGVTGVTDTFTAIHNHLAADPAASKVKVGDYIDLDSLTVAGAPLDNTEGGKFTFASNADLGGHGKHLRLIVVGINSFNAINSNNTPHVVFQFQNAPVSRRMNPVNDGGSTSTAGASGTGNNGGYKASEMRTYLVGTGTNGKFITGLIAAGVPQTYLWGPTRHTANGGGAVATGTDTLTDLLWLPTEYELFGSTANGDAAQESAANQIQLEYYNSNDRRKKYNELDVQVRFWAATARSGANYANFICPTTAGAVSSQAAETAYGCAPAFCIK